MVATSLCAGVRCTVKNPSSTYVVPRPAYSQEYAVASARGENCGAELLTTAQAAQLLQVHPLTLVLWRRQHRGPRYLDAPDARLIRYRRADLFRWLGTSNIQSMPKRAKIPHT